MESLEATKSSRPPIWSIPLQIRSYDVDVTRCATAQAICRYFLDAAWTHAETLGVGFSHLASQQRVWVLSRMLVQVVRRPAWGEIVTLATWPRGTETLFALRDFEMTDQTGMALLGGTSAWLVLNQTTRRPQRIEGLSSAIPVTPRKATCRGPQKLLASASASTSLSCTARPSDIDVNAHVNSARYLEWILDTYSLDFQKNHLTEELELNYLGETLAGDALSVFSQEMPAGQWNHSVLKAGGHEVCRASIKWKPIPQAN